MKINVSKEGNDTVISPEGELNTVTSKEFRAVIEGTASNQLIFDFAKVIYITSATLRVILATQQRIDEEGGRLSIRNLNEEVSAIFDETGFNDVVIIE